MEKFLLHLERLEVVDMIPITRCNIKGTEFKNEKITASLEAFMLKKTDYITRMKSIVDT
jgi:hypothetical protein